MKQSLVVLVSPKSQFAWVYSAWREEYMYKFEFYKRLVTRGNDDAEDRFDQCLASRQRRHKRDDDLTMSDRTSQNLMIQIAKTDRTNFTWGG